MLFTGSFSLSADDLAQYFKVVSPRFNLSGGRLHSTSRLLLEVPLNAPVMIRIAVFWITSSLAN